MKSMFKMLILSLFWMLCSPVQAQVPGSIRMEQVEPGGAYFLGKYLNPPNISGTYIMVFDGLTGTPRLAAIPSNMTWDGTSFAPLARVYNYPVRALNTCFQVSTTRDALLTYSASIATTLSLTTGQQGTIHLRTFTNSACTTGQQEISSITNGQTGSLSVGLNLIQSLASQLRAVVPAGAWVQLVTENIVGTPTFTWVSSQEILL